MTCLNSWSHLIRVAAIGCAVATSGSSRTPSRRSELVTARGGPSVLECHAARRLRV